ncbi:ATP-grasp domain-containing protein [Micromonospora sp. NPDC049903]|uniref:ATP-grasp domain-containing protein n=1 Tax=Micromonospora sp. NPDC049903 TaxID=3364276 RepID=UPI00379EAA51
MKHHWHEAAFIPDLRPHHRWQIAARFLELRADDFTGGFVLRAFEHLTSAEGVAGQRCWCHLARIMLRR